MSRRVDRYREAVWNAEKSELTPAEKFVLITMSQWMDFTTLGNCRPGWPRIIRRTSYSRDTVDRTIRSVIAKGWLIEDHKGGTAPKGGRRQASIYRGAIPSAAAEWSDHRTNRDGPNGPMLRTEWSDGRTPPCQVPVTPPGAGAPVDAPTPIVAVGDRIDVPGSGGATVVAVDIADGWDDETPIKFVSVSVRWDVGGFTSSCMQDELVEWGMRHVADPDSDATDPDIDDDTAEASTG